MDVTFIRTLLKSMQDMMVEKKEYLIDLDSVVGDGDLGLTMSDGFTSAYKAAEASEETDIGKMLYGSGKAMSIAVPSTMGTLMASGLMQAGKVLKGKTELDKADVIQLFAAFEEGVAHRGKAEIGDKTFLDGIHPAVEAMKACEESAPLKEIALAAKEAAQKGFWDTTKMIARHGRAATRGEASRSLEDPGAAVALLMMQALEKCVF